MPISEFRIYRCECTNSATNCLPTGLPYQTVAASSRVWVDEPPGGLDPAKHYCYAVSMGYTGICNGTNGPSESPVSAVACGSPCGPPPPGPLDVAFIIDNSSSMTNALAAIKESIASVLGDIAMASSNDFRLAIVTPDTNDDANPTNSLAHDGTGHDMVIVRLPFTNNAALFTNVLNSIQIGFGGNWPESTDECLNTVVNALAAAGRSDTNHCAPTNKLLQLGDFGLSFRTNAAKRVVIITDAIPGGFCDSTNLSTMAHVYAQQAHVKGIKINAVQMWTLGLGNPYTSSLGDTMSVMLDYANTSCGWYTDVPFYTDKDAIEDAIVAMLYHSSVCN